MSGNKQGRLRPALHFTAPEGWLNDPNGLIYYKGEYHLFYQHNPHGCEWGSMHWGHAVSGDLLHWRHLPMALTPGAPYDAHPQGGCFSGSAVEWDGLLWLVYTGSVPQPGRGQTQNLAYSEDGVHFTKYAGNPVLAAPPAGMNPQHFRDPKVFWHEGCWYMVVSSCVGDEHDGDARILLYRSPDLLRWRFVSVLLASHGRYGSMAECPDLFPLGGKWVLTFSPMHMPRTERGLWIAGELDFATGRFTPCGEGPLDYGLDYYAPQSFWDATGHRTALGWMNRWPWMTAWRGLSPTAHEGWRGALSLPRRYHLDEKGRLCSLPAPALLAARRPLWQAENLTVGAEALCLRAGPACELLLRADVAQIPGGRLTISLLGGGEDIARIELCPREGTLAFTASHGPETARCPLGAEDGVLDVRLVVDHSCVELFVDGGLHPMAMHLCPPVGVESLRLAAGTSPATLDRVALYSLSPG